MHVLIHMVADYGLGDLAFAEVAQRLVHHLPNVQLVLTPVPAFDTLSAGFCIAPLALTNGPTDRVVYCNVAPRKDENDPRPANEGERFVVGRSAKVCWYAARPSAGRRRGEGHSPFKAAIYLRGRTLQPVKHRTAY